MNRLFWKIFLSFWITEALVLTIAVTLANMGVWRETPDSLQQVQAEMPAVATRAVQAWEQGGAAALKQSLSDASEDSSARWWLVDASGKELSGNTPPWWVAQVVQKNSGAPQLGAAVYAASGSRGSYILVAEPGQPRVPHIPYRAIIRQLLAGLLVSGLTCVFVGPYLVRPILRLRRATQAVAAGDLSARAGEAVRDRKDEIGDLVRD